MCIHEGVKHAGGSILRGPGGHDFVSQGWRAVICIDHKTRFAVLKIALPLKRVLAKLLGCCRAKRRQVRDGDGLLDHGRKGLFRCGAMDYEVSTVHWQAAVGALKAHMIYAQLIAKGRALTNYGISIEADACALLLDKSDCLCANRSPVKSLFIDGNLILTTCSHHGAGNDYQP